MSKKGGVRVGAGRPMGSGIYGEPTVQIRIPESLVPTIKKMLIDFRKNLNKKTKKENK